MNFVEKILKNKLLFIYGILNNPKFLFYDPDLVNAITGSAYLTIKAFLQNLKTKLDGFEFIQSAADSVIFSSHCGNDEVEKIIDDTISVIEKNTGIKDKIKFTTKEYDYCFSFTTNKYCFVKDKNVVLKGFSKNIFFQKAFKALILKAISEKHSANFELEKAEIKKHFVKLPVEEISDYFVVGKMFDKYGDFLPESSLNDASKASRRFNTIIHDLDLDIQYICEDEKVKIIQTKSHDKIAFTNYLPEEIKNIIEIDWDKQFDLFFEKPIEELNQLVLNY